MYLESDSIHSTLGIRCAIMPRYIAQLPKSRIGAKRILSTYHILNNSWLSTDREGIVQDFKSQRQIAHNYPGTRHAI